MQKDTDAGNDVCFREGLEYIYTESNKTGLRVICIHWVQLRSVWSWQHMRRRELSRRKMMPHGEDSKWLTPVRKMRQLVRPLATGKRQAANALR